jgi:hypothetical protein
MHRHEMQQSNIYLGIYTIEYYFLLEKSRCYKPTPLKMNLVPEIQMDQKRNLEILLSTPLLFPR